MCGVCLCSCKRRRVRFAANFAAAVGANIFSLHGNVVALLADECERFVAACFVVACAVAVGKFPLKRKRRVVAFIADAVAIAINLAIIIKRLGNCRIRAESNRRRPTR